VCSCGEFCSSEAQETTENTNKQPLELHIIILLTLNDFKQQEILINTYIQSNGGQWLTYIDNDSY
jgi:hypothetical protein